MFCVDFAPLLDDARGKRGGLFAVIGKAEADDNDKVAIIVGVFFCEGHAAKPDMLTDDRIFFSV